MERRAFDIKNKMERGAWSVERFTLKVKWSVERGAFYIKSKMMRRAWSVWHKKYNFGNTRF